MEIFNNITKYEHPLSLDQPIKAELLTLRKGHKNAAHPDMHYALHLGVLIKGRYGINYQDHQGVIEKGQVWLTGPWEPHYGIRTGIPGEGVVFTIIPEQIGQIGPFSGINWLLPFFLSPSERPLPSEESKRKTFINIAGEVKKIIQENQTVGNQCLIWIKFHEIMLHLIHDTKFNSDTYNKKSVYLIRILPAIELIQKKNNDPVPLEEAAKICGLGISRFSEIFKSTMGLSFGKFAIRARLSGAIADLRVNTLTIKEIAEKWGFFDVSHLYRVLKQNINKNPGELKK